MLDIKRKFLVAILCSLFLNVFSQDKEWTIEATNIDPSEYYGITSANGMVGLVSSMVPMQVKDVVLNGVFDNYQRGRVTYGYSLVIDMQEHIDVIECL